MEPFSLVKSLLEPLWWLFPLLMLIAFLKTPLVKGWFGEKLVEKKAQRRLDSDIYRAFHNVTVQDQDGTTQIDHVYVSRFGIFVVETKNYKGWIFGSEKAAQWTQSIYKKKNKFQNPLRQNYKHIKALEALLKLPIQSFHSVIVFTGECEFKTPMPVNVLTLSNFDKYILSFGQQLLSESQVQLACQAIYAGRMASNRSTHKAHVRHLKDKHKGLGT